MAVESAAAPLVIPLGSDGTPVSPPTLHVDVIILHFGRIAETKAAIASVAASTVPVRIILVNNGAPQDERTLDGWLATLTPRPRYRIVRSGGNVGFATGVNLGLRVALRDAAPYLFLLNNDALVERETLERLIAAAERHPDVGVLSPVIPYADWPERVWSAGWRWRHHLRWPREVRLSAGDLRRDVVAVDIAAACAMLIPRATLDRVGLLDGRYFMYYEDVDFCLRARAAGLSVAIVPGARAYHRVGLTPRPLDPARVETWARSKAIFYAAWAGAGWGLPAVVRLALGLVAYGCRRALVCDWPSCAGYVRGTIDGWRTGRRGPTHPRGQGVSEA